MKYLLILFMSTIDCKKLFTIPQFSNTCWFNVVLVVFFYSDLMKQLILQHSKRWKKTTGLRKIFLEMIANRRYSYDVPRYILNRLYRENKDDWYFIPKDLEESGTSSEYIVKVLKYLNIHSVIILVLVGNDLYYQHSKYIKITNPEVIIVIIPTEFEIIGIEKLLYKKSFKLQIDLQINQNPYKLDSCVLVNWNHFNSDDPRHAIAGVTCNHERYIYNGWLKIGTKSPCHLMEFDWFNEKNDFCLDRKLCKVTEIKNKKMCYNMARDDRLFIYVKK